MKTKLNICSGYDVRPEYHNVDMNPATGCDETWDLENFPWPWPESSFEEIRAHHALEHLGEQYKVFIRILQELYRVSKPSAVWHVTVPHWRDDDFFHDPSHVRVITPQMITLFDQAKNVDDIRRNHANPKHGLFYGIDLELLSAQHDLREPWLTLQREGRISPEELRTVYESQANVVRQIHLVIRVHKPQRRPSL